jgi:hypothetical protein
MSNRRADRPVPKGYRRFTGEYEKRYYAIITLNGVAYPQCWPNAGGFSNLDGKRIEGAQVFCFKEDEYKWPR